MELIKKNNVEEEIRKKWNYVEIRWKNLYNKEIKVV